MHASVVERQKQIEIAEFEIQRREKELDYVVRKPAEAEKYRLEKMAEAYKKRVIMEAEAEAEAIAIKGLISYVTSIPHQFSLVMVCFPLSVFLSFKNAQFNARLVWIDSCPMCFRNLEDNL